MTDDTDSETMVTPIHSENFEKCGEVTLYRREKDQEEKVVGMRCSVFDPEGSSSVVLLFGAPFLERRRHYCKDDSKET